MAHIVTATMEIQRDQPVERLASASSRNMVDGGGGKQDRGDDPDAGHCTESFMPDASVLLPLEGGDQQFLPPAPPGGGTGPPTA